MAWRENVFWPAAKADGMLVEASTVLPGDTEPTVFDVDLIQPQRSPIDGTLSTDWTMEYQHDDAPTLREGAEVVVEDTMFRVRQKPEVSENAGSTGFFRIAILTRVGTVCSP